MRSACCMGDGQSMLSFRPNVLSFMCQTIILTLFLGKWLFSGNMGAIFLTFKLTNCPRKIMGDTKSRAIELGNDEDVPELNN